VGRWTRSVYIWSTVRDGRVMNIVSSTQQNASCDDYVRIWRKQGVNGCIWAEKLHSNIEYIHTRNFTPTSTGHLQGAFASHSDDLGMKDSKSIFHMKIPSFHQRSVAITSLSLLVDCVPMTVCKTPAGDCNDAVCDHEPSDVR
jgi:hypothetical protein